MDRSPAEVRRAAGRVGELVAQLRGSGRPVAVAGFSQGGAVALALGASGVQADAVVSICGFLPDVDEDDWAEALHRAPRSGPRHPPTLVVSGAEDEVVPAFLGEDAAAVLGQAGRDVTSVVLPGGHAVSPVMAERTLAWLVEALAPGMRVSLGLPVDRVDTGAELVSGDAIADLAVAYERLGFHAAYVTDHPAPDDRWLAGGGHQAMEPTVALAVAAAATRHLLVHTNVYVLPYRNPFLAAKALASLDVASAGRLIVGVAAGYLRPEFAALGVSFDDRTDRLEDALRAAAADLGRTVAGRGGARVRRPWGDGVAPTGPPAPPADLGGRQQFGGAPSGRAVRTGLVAVPHAGRPGARRAHHRHHLAPGPGDPARPGP